MSTSTLQPNISVGDQILHNDKEGVVIHDYGNGQIEVQVDRFKVELLNKSEVTLKQHNSQ